MNGFQVGPVDLKIEKTVEDQKRVKESDVFGPQMKKKTKPKKPKTKPKKPKEEPKKPKTQPKKKSPY